MSLQTVIGSIHALRPLDWLKVAGWIAFMSFLALFALSGSMGRLNEASFFLAMTLSTSAHAVCTTIHRRYLALRGLLPQLPLSRIGGSSEILTYDRSLELPLIDVFLYLGLFSIGYVATIFWFPSFLVLMPLYAATVLLDSRIIRKLVPVRVGRFTETPWMVLITHQPISYLPLVLGNTTTLEPRISALFPATLWILQATFLATLLHFQRAAPPSRART